MQSNTEKIKELRERTQAGILDCKKALEATDYNLDKAIEWLKAQGIAKAAKKGGAIAAEGVVAVAENNDFITMYEINSQTDFVAKNHDFQVLVKAMGDILINKEFSSIDEALTLTNSKNESIADLTTNLTAIIGEKIILRRAIQIKKANDEVYGFYVHNNHRLSAIIVLSSGSAEIARNLAMQVVSMNPEFLDESSIPTATIEAIKNEIYSSKTLENKSQAIKDSIATGMLNKKLSELTLVDQEFVMEKVKVKDYLLKHNAKALAMYRFQLAEGIEKKQENFAEEVAAQMKSVKED